MDTEAVVVAAVIGAFTVTSPTLRRLSQRVTSLPHICPNSLTHTSSRRSPTHRACCAVDWSKQSKTKRHMTPSRRRRLKYSLSLFKIHNCVHLLAKIVCINLYSLSSRSPPNKSKGCYRRSFCLQPNLACALKKPNNWREAADSSDENARFSVFEFKRRKRTLFGGIL